MDIPVSGKVLSVNCRLIDPINMIPLTCTQSTTENTPAHFAVFTLFNEHARSSEGIIITCKSPEDR